MTWFQVKGRRPTAARRFLATLAATLFSPFLLTAQVGPTVTWQGEVRPRYLGQEPVDGRWDETISMRSRLALDARFQGGLSLFVQIQDVREWGEETSNRDRVADAIDFHQAYLQVDSLPGIGGLVRAGRQEVTLAERRFLAAPDWGQAGQSFDGVRWIRPIRDGQLHVVYLRLQEASSPAHERDADMVAAWLAIPLEGFGSLDLLALHDRSDNPDGTRQSTVGSIWKRSLGDLSFRIQGMVQTGEREGIDVSARMLALSGTLAFADDQGSVTLWYDHLSGDADPTDGETGAFSTLFGARHRFYGRADYFLNIPEDTGGLGLRDAALKFAYTPTSLLSLNLDLHGFTTARRGTLSSRRLGEEVDLWIRYLFREALNVEAGYSLIRGGPALAELDRLDGSGNTVYLMTSLRF